MNPSIQSLSMENITLSIEKKIWNSVHKEDKIGLLDGLSGVALYYDYLILQDDKEEYKDKLIFVIDKINSLLAEELTSTTLSSGLAGYGLLLLKLKNDFISIDESYFTDIDSILEEDLFIEAENNNYDFLNGSMGICMYFIERYKKDKNTHTITILNQYAENLIHKINADLTEVLKKPVQNDHCYYFGMAHGVAGFVNFLVYMKCHFKHLNRDMKESLEHCLTFLKLHKCESQIGKQSYPNLLLIKENRFINPILSWCQGDLGISNALYNLGAFLNKNDVKNEAVQLVGNIKNISFENTGIADYALCHGTIGVLIQYHLASVKFNKDYSEEIKKWFLILEKQTDNFERFLTFDKNKETEEINMLNGLTGLALSLLTLDKKIDADWLEILNLH